MSSMGISTVDFHYKFINTSEEITGLSETNLVNSKIQNPITTNQTQQIFRPFSSPLALSRPRRLLLSNAQPSASSLPLRRISPARATLYRLPLSQRERLSLAKGLPLQKNVSRKCVCQPGTKNQKPSSGRWVISFCIWCLFLHYESSWWFR